MALRYWLAAMLLIGLAQPVLGQEKPSAKPKEIDKATIKAWEERGFELRTPPK
jgi:hypothetical protein